MATLPGQGGVRECQVAAPRTAMACSFLRGPRSAYHLQDEPTASRWICERVSKGRPGGRRDARRRILALGGPPPPADAIDGGSAGGAHEPSCHACVTHAP